MSEVSNQGTALEQQNIENISSNVDYLEYLNGVQSTCPSKEVAAKSTECAEPNAEDEVTAILLSAMMGSIVKCWDKKYDTVNNHSSHFIISKKSSAAGASSEFRSGESMLMQPTSKVTLYSQTSPREGTVLSSKRTELSAKGVTENVATVPIRSILNQEGLSINSLDRNQSKEDAPTQTKTVFIQNDIISEEGEENPLTHLRKLRELLMSDKEHIYGWEFLKSKEEFIISFKQGNRYEGKLLNCRMHGKGQFYWADDGSQYEGDFVHGKMIGQGKMYWTDQSWYEGEFNEGFRHGRGLYIDNTTFYAGHWKNGSRHGVGAMYYNKCDTKKDYYNGEWVRDVKHNTGLRSYPSGAIYSGQWSSGKRHGLGTMVWTNGDVYSGNYDKGKMHGYGEYTWDTFYNQQLVLPEENCYYGDWVKNIRHGNGTLETTSGVVVKGSWANGKKHGPAEVVCSNGNFLYADKLFEEDCLCLSSDKSVEEDSLNASLNSLYRLPITSACHNIELGYYVNRLVEFTNESCLLRKAFCNKYMDSPVKTDSNRSIDPTEHKFDFFEEEVHLRNVLMQFLSPLKVIYKMYAQVCCEVKPNFSTILMRLMWWQLLRDCDLHSKGFSLAHFDTCIANNKACLVQGVHYPFEKILFWQFLHCLIEVSWVLYAKNFEGTRSIKGILASGLHRVITTDLIPNAGRHKGNALFKCRDLMSLDSLYRFYRKVGEPHSARDFLKNAIIPQEKDSVQKSVPKYSAYQIRGKNIFGVGGKLTYFPNEEPLLTDSEYQEDPNHPKDLSCLRSLGLMGILKCILEVCKTISTNGLLVNMDYNIVFLEFYEILLLCALTKARTNILARKKNKEEERTNIISTENNTTEDPSTNIKEVASLRDKSSNDKKSSITKNTKKKKK